jgi:hypothetical protein
VSAPSLLLFLVSLLLFLVSLLLFFFLLLSDDMPTGVMMCRPVKMEVVGNSTTEQREVRQAGVSFAEAKRFMISRVSVSAFLGGLLGGSAGYFVGGDMFLRLGTGWTIAGGVIGLQFYGTALILQALRGVDDWANYGVSGSFSMVSTMKYLEHSNIIPKSGYVPGLTALLLGFTSGTIYKFAEGTVYEVAREKWIKNRYILKHEAKVMDSPGIENYSGRTPGYYTERGPSSVPVKPWNYPGRPYMPNAPPKEGTSGSQSQQS